MQEPKIHMEHVLLNEFKKNKNVTETAKKNQARSIWPIDGTLTGTSTLGLSKPRSNGNKGILHTFQISRTGASPSDTV